MIDRSEGAGLTVALAGHVVLFGLLSVGFLATPNPDKLKSTPIEVSLADEIGMESTAPVVSHEELAAKKSPVEAPVEPDEAPPEPAPPEPAPVAKPQPSPPKPAPAPIAKPQPPAKPAPVAPAAPRKPTNRPVKPTGNLDGLDLGRSNNKTNSTATNNPASAASSAEVASFRALIARQIQPCANRQVTPGPGAERIKVSLRISFNRDGSLAGSPAITGVQGNDGGNSRYVERVKDLAIATFKGCTPVHGLPDELYDVSGGWKSLNFSYKLPG